MKSADRIIAEAKARRAADAAVEKLAGKGLSSATLDRHWWIVFNGTIEAEMFTIRLEQSNRGKLARGESLLGWLNPRAADPFAETQTGRPYTDTDEPEEEPLLAGCYAD